MADDAETSGDYTPCIACIMETRTRMIAAYRMRFDEEKVYCYCNKHTNEIALRAITSGDTVIIGDRELGPLLPYDIATEIETRNRIWRVGHDANVKQMRERLMKSVEVDEDDEPAPARKPKQDKRQQNIEWL